MEIGAIVLGVIIGVLWWLFNKHEDALQALGRCILNSAVAAVIIYLICLGGWWTVGTILCLIFLFVNNKRYGNR